MSTLLKPVLSALLITVLGTAVTACHKEGPAERAGKKLDNAATDVGNAVEDKCEQVKEGMNAKDTDC
jgi:hypothetical protein